MRAQITGLNTAQKNAQDGVSLVQTAEGALTEVHSMLNRMVELADQSANGTYDNAVDRANLQKEITSLKSEIDRIADSTNFNGIDLLNGDLSVSTSTTLNAAVDAAGNKAGVDLKFTFAEQFKGNTINVKVQKADNPGDPLKVRAQITGLNTAQKNAQDGVSLVQTAEGALTEVHSMLNRMVELADQSANGTYDNAVDRANLQKEITSLKSEIDRIADSTNFNGIDLLNGDLSVSTSTTLNAAVDAAGNKAGVDLKFTFAEQFKGNTINVKVQKADNPGDPLKASVAADGTITIKADQTKTYSANEIKEALSNAALDGGITGDDKVKMEELLSSVSVTGEGLKGATGYTDFNGTTVTGTTTGPKGEALTLQIGDTSADFNQMSVSVGDMHTDALGIKDIDISNQAGAKAAVDKIKAAINTVSSTRGDLGAIHGEGLKGATGYTDFNGTTVTGTTTGPKGEALTLQIGDTSADFNQMSVSVGDMHTDALGIKDIDISNQAGAKAAVDKIKAAINTVSSTRGDLGAIQNRLEHTINNLSVTAENMTAAESRIRDVDMANEMMAYTKNNILVQSSQAMLAQANQIPQGVLQLLQ